MGTEYIRRPDMHEYCGNAAITIELYGGLMHTNQTDAAAGLVMNC